MAPKAPTFPRSAHTAEERCLLGPVLKTPGISCEVHQQWASHQRLEAIHEAGHVADQLAISSAYYGTSYESWQTAP